jgi:predicted alpha/beta hydrolase
MPVTDIQIPARDGFALSATLFMPEPEATPRAGIVINSATGVHRRFYARFATFLAEQRGFAVLTYDYRGIADSRPQRLRTFKARMRDWPAQDMPAVLEWMRATVAPGRLILIGHSSGGNLIGLIPNLSLVDAAVLIGAQLGYWRHWPARIRYGMAVLWYVLVPAFSRTLGYIPSWLGAGQHWPHGIALELARWCRHPEFLFGDPSLDASRYATFDAPILACSFTDDPHATRTACEHLLARFQRARITHRHIAPKDLGIRRIGHFGFFRQPCAPLWEECAHWINAVIEKNPLRATELPHARSSANARNLASIGLSPNNRPL